MIHTYIHQYITYKMKKSFVFIMSLNVTPKGINFYTQTECDSKKGKNKVEFM